MSRNTRSMIGLGIAFTGIVIGFLLMRRTQARQTLAANNEVIPARPPENPVNRINIASSSSSSFFQANNSSGDIPLLLNKTIRKSKKQIPLNKLMWDDERCR